MDQLALNRFMRQVEHGESGCWLWIGTKVGGGYGRIGLSGRYVMAHRAAYEHFIGKIPAGLTIDHLCRNPSCVNPQHLEPVSQAENNARANLGWWFGSRDACANGHLFDEENTVIRLAPTPARICRTCARERTRRYRARKASAALEA